MRASRGVLAGSLCRRLGVVAAFGALAAAGCACDDESGDSTPVSIVTSSEPTVSEPSDAGDGATGSSTSGAITSLPPEEPEAAAREAVLREVRSLQALSLPPHFEGFNAEPVRTGDEFDVNEYFEVLDHLAMEEGYTLDYVYYFNGHLGAPRLYARPVTAARYGTATEFEEQHDRSDHYLRHVVTDDTEEGFFQLALLDIVAGQFYLWWHAAYNDTDPVLTRVSLAAILDGVPEMAADQSAIAQAVDPASAVTLSEGVAEVRLYTWTEWGGLELRTYRFGRAFPHEVLAFTSEPVAEYTSSVVF